MAAVRWAERGAPFSARWHSENDTPAPSRVVVVDDGTTAKAAYRLARGGTGLLWRGDFHNARQLLRAMDRLHERSRSARTRGSTTLHDPAGNGTAALFHSHRAERAERARLLGSLLVLLEPDHTLALRRAPDVREAADHAYGTAGNGVDCAADGHGEPGGTCVALTELVGVLSAYQWHLQGVEIGALGARIHPAYGVFSPVRGEYVDLVADTPFPGGEAPTVAFDLGTGTGVLTAVLVRRGAGLVVATDINPRAVACARANVRRLGLAERVQVAEADLWPDGRADLVVCNPPWLPARPTSALELGIYDAGSDLLHRFLDGLAEHLLPAGEGWLVLSDLAEHLGLRTRDELLTRIADAGLRVAGRHDTTPQHPRAQDAADALHEARRREVTSLWRLIRDS
ncbi:class I SAM-dependent methyltransferase [Promicromonospora iranensis]|uniref:SAM-dependent methyltransferase n=1 Tax=Promicromonospora iranensis TaxID=1105144 RepID=A0ABU2CLL1_9MICO|nr:class I SAM-dependent methyltransferase [Promicromonospora iranensis]MDR7382229.1 SAM-dependent methyltransferase [Promicromonospora iranensis]